MALKFRRGTTAQQSGSLAFGEPYVNTDLNTLQVGGANGDILLAAAGTSSVFVGQSVSASSWISASSLHVTGNANVGGDLTIAGKIQIGDNSSDTVNVVASLSSSLIPSLDNTFDLGDANHIWRDLYISTGSIKMVSNGVVVSTLSNTGNGMALDQGIVANGNSSFGTSSAAITAVTGSLKVSGSISLIGELSASTINGIGNVSLYSSSVASRLAAAESFSSSLDSTFATDASVTIISASAWGAFQSASAYSASAATDVSASNAARVALSASVAASGFAVSSSVASATAASITSLSSSVKAVTDTFATSASVASATAASITSLSSSVAAEQYAKLNVANTFTGTQTVTGSVYVSGNLVVQGSSSLQNITASVVSIGTNKVILNTDNPAVRFGGISVIDSGSSASTGSLFWDSTNNVWLYQNPDGAGYASAKLISGPKNSGSLGNEIGLTVGKVLVAVGDDHIGDSIISASVTKVTVEGALDVTGNISSSTITGIGNVTLYSTSVDSRIVTNINSAAGAFASASAYSSSAATALNSLSSSIATTDSTQTTNITTAQNSANGAFASASAYSGSFYTTINTAIGNTTTAQNSAAGAFASASAYSASAAVIDNGQDVLIGSLRTNILSASVYNTFSTSVASRVNTLETAGYAVSSSVASATATSISTISGSVKTVTDALSGRVTTLEGKDISITLTGDVTGTGTITDLANVSFATTIAADSVALGTDTTGNYVATMTAGAGITVGTATGEGSTPVITNTGVTSITGTANQVVASASTGGVTLSLPQSIATTSAVAFASVSATGDIVAYSGSDKRLKNNIINISDAVTKVRKLNGVTWKWNDDVNEVTKTAPTTGLIAQEVQEVLPEVVNEREDGYLGIDYSKMVGLLVEAIKEQQNQIDSLTIEIENLKKNNSL